MMIILFHVAHIMASDIFHAILSSLTNPSKENEKNCHETIIAAGMARFVPEQGLRFNPPVYIQRYQAVMIVLQDPRWSNEIKKVVDFGCAELGFFTHLKTMPDLEHILAIDIDKSLLQSYKLRAAPLIADYLKYRTKALTVEIVCGSVDKQDPCLCGTDAVVAIELIEHLYPETLAALPYTIFGYIQPKVAVFTTPNVEFNILFEMDSSMFRHDDHKFEWSQLQFIEWAKGITSTYPAYSVSFAGIGPGPDGTDQFGCCSQMAIFTRNRDVPLIEPPQILKDGNYEVIDTFVYPMRIDSRTDEQKILNEAEYHIKYFNYDMDEYDEQAEIPLNRIMPFVKEWCDSVTSLRDVLVQADWRVIEKESGELFVLYPRYSTESFSSFSDGEATSGNEVHNTVLAGGSESDWDSPPNDSVHVSHSSFRSEDLHLNVDHEAETDRGKLLQEFPDKMIPVASFSEKDPSPINCIQKKEDFSMENSFPEDSSCLESFSWDGQKEKGVDSGYPNSVSAQDVNMDLSSELVEEMLTENDALYSSTSSLADDSSEPDDENILDNDPALLLPPPIRQNENEILLIDLNVDEVVNGDVANNNRDGEGNNAVAVNLEPLAIDVGFDPAPLLAEDFDNDNNIAMPDIANPFPDWLLQLLNLAHHEAGDFPNYFDAVQEHDIDFHVEPQDENLGNNESGSDHESEEERLLGIHNLDCGDCSQNSSR